MAHLHATLQLGAAQHRYQRKGIPESNMNSHLSGMANSACDGIFLVFAMGRRLVKSGE